MSGSLEEVTGLADAVIELVGAGAEAAVTVTAGHHALTRFAGSAIHQNVAEDVLRVDLTLAASGRVTSVTTGRRDPGALADLVARARSAVQVTPEDPGWPGVGSPGGVEVRAADRADPATAEAGPEVRAGLVAAFVGAAEETDAAGYCETRGTVRAFASSAGLRRSGTVTVAVLDGIHRRNGRAGSGHRAAARVGDLDGEAAGRDAVHRLGGGQVPVTLEPGAHRVVLGPRAVAELVSFLAFYGFNAKAHDEGQSFVQLGEQQLDPSISLWDDANDQRTTGFQFDAEGTARVRLDLIRDGVSRALTHDRRSAARAGASSTGHAPALEGSQYGPFATNLVLGPGPASLDELVAAVDRGLLVSELHYCRILDPKTQVVTGLTRNGTFLIEDGRVGPPADDLRFTQSFTGALAPGQVLGIGSDATLIDATTLVPSIAVAGWQFSGGARG